MAAREPDPFCRSCHAPEADPARAPQAAAADIGVACVTCHVPPDGGLPGDAVLAAPLGEPAAAPSPHAIVRRASFSTAQACARCHEFSSKRDPSLMMQTTVSEHARSSLVQESCQSCHMPVEGGVRSHGFYASRDPALLRAALRVEARRPRPGHVVLTLQPQRVGHAVPTGDPFRRLMLEIDRVTPGGLAPLDRRALTRTIETERSGYFPRRVEVSDTRVGGRDFEPEQHFELEGNDAFPIVWRVAYERHDASFGHDVPQLFARTVLFEGTLEAPR